MNYFPFHLGDYAAHTAHLEPMEDLAYRRLLDQYYLRECALPADIQVTAKLVRMRSMIGDVESVLNEFFELTEAGWTHARCEDEIVHMQDKQAKARASAAASVKSRQAFAAKHSKTNATPADESANERSTGVENKQADVELPTPTPTPTPTPIVKESRETTRGSRLSQTFEPDFDFAKQNGIANPTEELAKFRDYWNSQAGQKAVKTDWQATWRNWVRNAKKPLSGRAEPSEPAWRREQRERTANAVPGIAAKSIFDKQIIDVEVYDVATAYLD